MKIYSTGISVELQAELITNVNGGNVRKALLTPDPHSSTIYKSRVFTLASGDEAGNSNEIQNGINLKTYFQ
jgi:hypothetical protein